MEFIHHKVTGNFILVPLCLFHNS